MHLNFALREPLVLDGPLPDDDSGRDGGRPWVTRPRAAGDPPQALVDGLRAELEARPHAVLVAGRAERDPRARPGARGVRRARRDPAARRPAVGRPPSGRPRSRTTTRCCATPTGPPCTRPTWCCASATCRPRSRCAPWLHGLDEALQIAFDPEDAWQDPAGAVATILAADPRATLEADQAQDGATAPGSSAGTAPTAPPRPAIARALGPAGLSEPRVAAELGSALPAEATVVVASSMPVRDVETFFPARERAPRVLANRGANGIDGTVSTAFGVAAVADGPVVLLIGDVALDP